MPALVARAWADGSDAVSDGYAGMTKSKYSSEEHDESSSTFSSA